MQEWRARNGKKTKVYHKNRHARKRGATGRYTPLEWDTLKDAYNDKCLRYGRQEPEITLTIDHIVPLVHGGTNDISNLQPLCTSCNSWKHVRTIDYRPDYATEQERAEQLLAKVHWRKRRPLTSEHKAKIAAMLRTIERSESWCANIAKSVKKSWEWRGAQGQTTSGIRGVTWDAARQKWLARATVNRKRLHLGHFDTVEEAQRVVVLTRQKNEPLFSDSSTDTKDLLKTCTRQH